MIGTSRLAVCLKREKDRGEVSVLRLRLLQLDGGTCMHTLLGKKEFQTGSLAVPIGEPFRFHVEPFV